MDYPQLVSQLVLYLGAGMTVRNIFFKLADEYVQKREGGMKPRYMQEELLRMVRALRAGQSETKHMKSLPSAARDRSIQGSALF